MTEYAFTEEWISVGDLTIDRDVQRAVLDTRKVERILRKFNPGALGVITVSRRDAVTVVVLDGQHRTEVVRRRTNGAGKVLCHVFKDLTRAEEAQMFLDLNAGNQPTLIDKFKKRIVAGDEMAIRVNNLVNSYQWSIDINSASGVIQAVGTLERIQTQSEKAEADPSYLQIALMLVTHAWGHNKDGAAAVLLEGIAAFYAEYKDLINMDRFSTKLKNYRGGPVGLVTEAKQIAAMNRGRLPMAVAERLTDEYNVGAKTRSLHPWRKRR